MASNEEDLVRAAALAMTEDYGKQLVSLTDGYLVAGVTDGGSDHKEHPKTKGLQEWADIAQVAQLIIMLAPLVYSHLAKLKDKSTIRNTIMASFQRPAWLDLSKKKIVDILDKIIDCAFDRKPPA